ncbi:beta-ketoacyl synthase chain length factor [Marilutibacter chinensis]|uniref:Beta-ketoacyl synthase chain length factor n=1 Tax=Marilutibacter chinensis TaxID=2912247 RepID=A0ABS9HVW5_9GAMM|nr:beta-ketoacyl synthase chain length factor [Lysobacter chinensis]MCF7222848.1 beta-ketoacyl synthase chain length factor [Lysobacter chinensis]
MKTLAARIEGIGFWTDGLPSWQAARTYARTGMLPGSAPARPSPQLLAANERRRAPQTVAIALEAGLAACIAAGRDPATLPSVFASSYGDLAITDYMCSTLATQPRSVSPTRFHNSVHNAAAGYWTIGTGAMQPASAICAARATFALGLVEALAQLATGEEAVLLVAYDADASGPIGEQARSAGLLGGALVLSEEGPETGPVLQATLTDGSPSPPDGPLARHAAANAMAPMLPLFDALACGVPGTTASVPIRLDAGAGRVLSIRLLPGATAMESVDA